MVLHGTMLACMGVPESSARIPLVHVLSRAQGRRQSCWWWRPSSAGLPSRRWRTPGWPMCLACLASPAHALSHGGRHPALAVALAQPMWLARLARLPHVDPHI